MRDGGRDEEGNRDGGRLLSFRSSEVSPFSTCHCQQLIKKCRSSEIMYILFGGFLDSG